MQKSSDPVAIAVTSPGAVMDAAKAEPVASLSIIVPIYNEVDNIQPLYDELVEALDRLGKIYEIIFVDDGSTDGSQALLARLAAQDRTVRVIEFRRNYGQTAAMKAGIDHAGMDVIVTIDGDRQNDPADIAPMIAALEDGADLVHGWRKNRQDALISRKIPSWLANRLIARTTRFPIRDLGCTLKVIRRRLLLEIELYGDMHRFIPILLHERGARCREAETHHRPRVAGQTKYGIGRTLRVLLDLLTVKYLLDYAKHPMRLFGAWGLASLLASVIFMGTTIFMKLAYGSDMTGNPLLLGSFVSGLAGIQLLSLGLLGEILSRLHYGQGRRQSYSVRRLVNFEPSEVTKAVSVR